MLIYFVKEMDSGWGLASDCCGCKVCDTFIAGFASLVFSHVDIQSSGISWRYDS